MISTEQIALLLSALGIGAVLRDVAKSVLDRRKLGADTTSVLTTIAVSMVAPLSAQLEDEREQRVKDHVEHIAELQAEREQAALLKRDLDAALEECRTLRRSLTAAHAELTALRARLDG